MSVWDDLSSLSDLQFRNLVAATAEVLLDTEEAGHLFDDDFLTISNARAAEQLLPELREIRPNIDTASIKAVLDDPNTSREISLKILEEVANYPELAQEIETLYDEKMRKMDAGAVVLLAAAVVILAIKIKEISWEKKTKKVSFYNAGSSVKAFVTEVTSKFSGL